MKRLDFDNLVLEKNKIIFDSVIALGALISFVSSYLLFANEISLLFAWVDVGMGCFLIVLYLFKNQIRTVNKITIAIGLTMVLGMMLLLENGFAGSGFYLFILVDIIATTLLSKQKSMITIGITVFFIIIIIILIKMGLLKYSEYDNHLNNLGEWSIHLGTYLLNASVIFMTVNGIKSYLLENIARLEESVEHIFKLAYFDTLTHLPNRAKFLEDLTAHNQGDNKTEGYLVLAEIKGFKLLNSIYSIEFGDEILIKIANILSDYFQGKNKVARVGGGEFAIWIDSEIDVDLNKQIDNLLELMDQNLRDNGIHQKIEFYICYSKYPVDDATVEGCFQKATMTLSYVRSLKNGSVCSYNSEIDQKTRLETVLKDKIREAIKQEAFQVVYQEKIDSDTGKVFGVEALARWHSNPLGEISPAIFIPIIEKNNLAVEFGTLMINLILDDFPLLKKKYNEKIFVSINISPSHFMSKDFNSLIMNEITKRELQPESILLEITEEIMLDGFEHVESVLAPLRAFGVGISLDDFGTGYSSLSYFAKMDFSELKIDKSFIDQIGESHKVNDLIKAIIQLAALYKVDVVAEGVETKEQLDVLSELGCHLIQGYYFSRPESLEH